jgi:hypothetical protein
MLYWREKWRRTRCCGVVISKLGLLCLLCGNVDGVAVSAAGAGAPECLVVV